MRKLELVLGWCVAMSLVAGACSSEEDDDGGSAGRGGMDAGGGTKEVGGSETGGRAGAGEAGGGLGGTSGSGGRPRGGTGGQTGGAGSGGGHGGACDQEVTNGLIQRTLAEYCLDNDCPQTLDGARGNVRDCRERQYSEQRIGCGYTVVSFNAEDWGRGFVFDGGELVGAYWFDDVIEPPCDTQGEVGGIYPPLCADTERCRICDQEDGLGGAGPFCDFGVGGEGGLGGGPI